jgi:hypothetical protein
MKDQDKKAEAKKRKDTERELDEALEESFPASDPIQSTGTSAGAPDEHTSKTPARKHSGG